MIVWIKSSDTAHCGHTAPIRLPPPVLEQPFQSFDTKSLKARVLVQGEESKFPMEHGWEPQQYPLCFSRFHSWSHLHSWTLVRSSCAMHCFSQARFTFHQG